MTGVAVLALRSFRVRGEVVQAGTTARLAPLDALLVLESMRGQLVDPAADFPRLQAAAQAAAAAQAREQRPAARSRADGPWQPLH